MSGNAEFTAAFFDEASVAWRANKKHVGDGMFKYIKASRVAREPKAPREPKVAREPKVTRELKAPTVLQILKALPPLRRSPRFLKA